jgi:tryptophan-rich sensory protein
MPRWLTVALTVGVMWTVIACLGALAVCWFFWGRDR